MLCSHRYSVGSHRPEQTFFMHYSGVRYDLRFYLLGSVSDSVRCPSFIPFFFLFCCCCCPKHGCPSPPSRIFDLRQASPRVSFGRRRRNLAALLRVGEVGDSHLPVRPRIRLPQGYVRSLFVHATVSIYVLLVLYESDFYWQQTLALGSDISDTVELFILVCCS